MSTKNFWSVYNYVARQWYETEYGVNDATNWYRDAMIFLERLEHTRRLKGEQPA